MYKSINEVNAGSGSRFSDVVVDTNKPAVFRDLVKDWPLVTRAKLNFEAAAEYLKSFDSGERSYAIVGQPDISGRFFYSDDLQDLNYKQASATVGDALDQVLNLADVTSPHAIALQACKIRQCLPGLESENVTPLIDAAIEPTLWLGNRALVAPHYDNKDNLACVAVGQRQFTLFPPDQTENLYIGPLENSPGGVPTSLVDIRNPNFDQHPRFRAAQDVATTAVLNPGDAIYIPRTWWHAVESLMDLNVLVNYWWADESEQN